MDPVYDINTYPHLLYYHTTYQCYSENDLSHVKIIILVAWQVAGLVYISAHDKDNMLLTQLRLIWGIFIPFLLYTEFWTVFTSE